MDTVYFADGSSVGTTKLLFLPDMGVLYIYVPGMSWQDAVSVFTDATKTKKITYIGKEILGYTHVDCIMKEAGGLKACLSLERTQDVANQE